MKKILLYGFKYIFKYKTLYFVYFASQILISLSELFIPIMEGAVIDSLVKTDLNIFIKNIIVLILIMLFSLAFSIIGSYLYFLLQVKCGNEANVDEIHNLYSISYKNLLNKDPSVLNQTINNDCNDIIMFCLSSVQQIIIAIFSILFMIFIVLTQSILFVFVLLISTILYLIIYYYFKDKIYNSNKQVLESTGAYFGALYQLVYYLKSIKMCSLFENIKSFENKVFMHFFSVNKKQQFIESCNNIFINLVSILTQILIYIIGAILVVKHHITVGMVVTITNYYANVISNTQIILNFWNNVQKCRVSCDRLSIYHNISKMNGKELIEDVNTVYFDHLSFRYIDQEELIHYNGSFEKGNIYRILGKNGTGKSTFIQVILGVFGNDYGGRILVNSIDMKKIDMNYFIFKNVAVCLQEPLIIEDTIERNLIPNDNYSGRYLEYLLKGFNMVEIIDNMADGINTVLHPLNSNLSGGEKQKIGIIRALLSKANVLVFDEPTSALDKESSRFFQQCINKIENKIIIIISHDDLEYLESKEKKVFLI